MYRRSNLRGSRFGLSPIVVLALSLLALPPNSVQGQVQDTTFVWDAEDPRVGLGAGWMDAEEAIRNLEKVGSIPRPEGFVDSRNPGSFPFANTDLAFQGDYVFVGNYSGFQVFDVSDPTNPQLRVGVICPGGQGDVSVYGDLLFTSVEETRGRLDCGTQGVQDTVSVERFRGVRIFDISDIDTPKQVALVQTCRGSHTHTVVTKPGDDENVWIYVSGTGGVRSPSELEGCSRGAPEEDPNTSRFRIEVIRVPLANPEEARIVSEPRIFADPETGEIAGLSRGGSQGEGAQRGAETNHCHDITAYPELGLAAGACSGNGILLDISDPENPIRIDEVSDPNFAYWHSATFSNDGSSIIFTDEWGGGTSPRCRATDPPTWGADAIFELVDGKMTHVGYYKLPVPQEATENCVAHNGSLIPVPGRDIKVQAWYQGGLSIFDFTDPANPFEIAFFDRGPLDEARLMLGGYWSTYWFDGYIYGAEIARGLDIFGLTPSDHLTANEIEAALLAEYGGFNTQAQPRVTWPAATPVARAYLDQMARNEGIDPARAQVVEEVLSRVDGGETPSEELASLAETLEADAIAAEEMAGSGDAKRLRLLAETLKGLAQE
jgi:hypothetical protein